MPRSEKVLKEAFVSNLPGGPINEINYVTAVAPAAVILWSALQSRLSLFTPYGPQAFVLDFLLNCGAILLATTLYSSAPVLLSLLLISPAILLYFLLPPSRHRNRIPRQRTKHKGSDGGDVDQRQAGSASASYALPQRPFVTTYRGCMLVITCVAILAVDFKVFPRRFAKVETWGTSLMDLGVGSFVFSAGLVSARGVLKERAKGENNAIRGLPGRLWNSLLQSLPLVVLGVVRLLTTKRLEYQEHVTEYGVHWNFFFTLALLPPFVAVFQTLFVALIPSYALMALAVGGLYTLCLELTDLKRYIISAPRTDFLSMNREGIFSFWGYLSIFLAGQSTGMNILAPWSTPRQDASPSSRSFYSYSRLRACINNVVARAPITSHLAFAALFYSFIYHFITSSPSSPISLFSLTPSRRLANLPYVLWVCAFNNAQLLAFHLVHAMFVADVPEADIGNPTRASKDPAFVTVSPILTAFNRNGIVVFVVANLLTGVVNLSVDTLKASSWTTMAILLAYMACLAAMALGWSSFKAKTR